MQEDRDQDPRKIEFFRHNVGPEEQEAVTRVLQTLFLTAGPETAAFEKEFSAFLGDVHSVGMSSCTIALEVALAACGVGPGDEVITTPMSYVATSNSALLLGATPVFVDVEPQTGNLDASRVEAAITPRTKAILPVHLYGHMCDMKALAAIAQRHNLVVIEDAAHCIEGVRDGIRPSQLGAAACFSFYATKNITAGEGGMVSVRDGDLMARLKRLRNHGIDRGAHERHQGGYAHWNQVELGFKANMSDIQAAMLRPQLRRIEAMRQQREVLAARYDEAFSGNELIRPMEVLPGTVSARHIYPVLVPPESRDRVLVTMNQQGIGVAVNYRPVHLMDYYRQRMATHEGMFPNAELIGASTITLPLYPKLTVDEQKRVIETIARAVEDG